MLVFSYAYAKKNLAIVQVEPNRYFSDLYSSSEGSLGRLEESETYSSSARAISTRCQKIIRKIYKLLELFLTEKGSCSYDGEIIGDIEVSLRYKHLGKQWVPRYLPQLNIVFCVNERIYGIAPSSLHGLGLIAWMA